MRILEGDPAAVGASYMADDDPALDRISPNETCDLRMSAWLWVVESAAAVSFVQCDSPAVPMWTGRPPRRINPAKLKQISVGTLASIPTLYSSRPPFNGYHTRDEC